MLDSGAEGLGFKSDLHLSILGVKRVFIFLLLILVLSYHFMRFITSNPGQKRVLIYCYERRKS